MKFGPHHNGPLHLYDVNEHVASNQCDFDSLFYPLI
jgi:hypothetical protein